MNHKYNTRNQFGPKKVELISGEPSSHLYYAATKAGTYSGNFTKNWKKHYNILQKSLPDGIFVKFYNDRIDLGTIMICGPPDTPYEGCLFFFDLYIPPKFPNVPPYVKYISFCVDGQIHPNIFRDGYICISLLQLGPRSKAYTINWMPDKSTLLQVCISLQGLVLSKNPAYNISHYKTFDVEKSKEVNGKILNVVIKSMIAQITNPPQIFKEEILKHYTENGMKIYEKLLSYTKRFNISGVSRTKRIKIVHEPLFPLALQISEETLRQLYDTLKLILVK